MHASTSLRRRPRIWNHRSALVFAIMVALVGAALAPRVAPAQGFVADGSLQPVGDVNFLQDFPHVAAYMRLSSDGHQLDSDAMVEKLARFNVAVIPASPATEYLGARLQQLRALNPRIILLAYFPSDFMWDGTLYPVGNIYGDTWRMLQSRDWWVHNTTGAPFTYFGNTTDITNPEAQDSLARLVADRVLASGLWDGLFLDDFCESNWWKNGLNGQAFDLDRNGVADDQASFEALWRPATDSLAAKIRRLIGPAMPMVGNCAYGSKWTTMNGWMREDFPRLGTWTSNMLSPSGGYLVNEQKFLSPHYNFVYSTSAPPPSIYDASNLRFMRYGLGSALLGDGYFMFDPQVDTVLVSGIWCDEYDAGGRGRGYLGQPLAGYYQQVGTLGTPDLLTNTGFESGFTNWHAYNYGGTWLIDPSTKVEGAVSAHAVIPVATPYTSMVHQQQTVSLPYGTWAVTFWARAAAERDMWVHVQRTESPLTILCYTPVRIGTSWKQYQVAFNNSIGTVPVNVQVQFGQLAVDAWVDDMHLQQGASSVYRRDFQNGTVLVNSTGNNVTVSLERPYQRLSGTQDPATNDGSTVSQLVVPGNSAAILTNPTSPDLTPPGAVSDLRLSGPPAAPRPVRAKY
ncbi:MAG: hypothetical protein HZB25_07835 [Candidatus Eisenbacteria bacterium]|nr:hypothetical protein [Candidatus Eisenbacteria bacterium]